MVVNRTRDLAQQGGRLPVPLGRQHPLTELLDQTFPVDLSCRRQLAELSGSFGARPCAGQVEIGHTERPPIDRPRTRQPAPDGQFAHQGVLFAPQPVHVEFELQVRDGEQIAALA